MDQDKWYQYEMFKQLSQVVLFPKSLENSQFSRQEGEKYGKVVVSKVHQQKEF